MKDEVVPAQLRYIEQVARSGSIQKAAKVLGIAASAVNRRILDMEQDLGTPLFERLPRGMRLTPTGESIVSMASRWRSDVRRVNADIQQIRGLDQGLVRVGCMDSYANGILADVIADQRKSYPGIALDIEIASTDDVVEMLMEGAVDIAVAFNASPRRELHAMHTYSLPFGCIVAPGHPLAKRPSVSLQECGRYPIILQSGALVIGRIMHERYGWLLGSKERPPVTNSIQLIKTLVRSGVYAAFLTSDSADPELQEGTLTFLPVRDALVDAETLSILIDSRRPLHRIVRLVADLFHARIQVHLNRRTEVMTANNGSTPR